MATSFSSFFLSSVVLLLITHSYQTPSSSSASFHCHPKDQKALLQIKQSFNNPSLFSSWDPQTSCCKWDLIECDPKTHRVTGLFINYGNLTGKIPSAVGRLIHLENLLFRKLPNLTGEIPAEICNLKNLTALELSFNPQLSGSIPECLGDLQNLEQLELSFNRLTGSIPATLGNLTKLWSIVLYRNRLTGKIPDLFTRFDRGTGFQPVLLLSHNNLSGEIPKSMSQVNIETLDLGWNRLEGDASHIFNRSSSMEVLDLCRNLLDFDLSEVGFPARSLVGIDLSHNRIRGSIPAEILEIEKLRWFNVSYNRLCGEIPRSEKLKMFGYSSFFHNRCLCGSPLGPCKSG